MRDLTRLAGFLVAVVVVFGLAFGVGHAVGAVGDAPAPASENPTDVTNVTTSTMGDHQPSPTTAPPAGSGSHAGSHPTTTSS